MPLFPAEAFVVCENYSPPEGFNEKDLHRLLEKIGSPSGADDLGILFLPMALVFCRKKKPLSLSLSHGFFSKHNNIYFDRLQQWLARRAKQGVYSIFSMW